MKSILSVGLAGVAASALLAAPGSPRETLDAKISAILPKPNEDRWLLVPWRTNLMAARDEAQRAGKPVFLWVMVGNPQGCT